MSADLQLVRSGASELIEDGAGCGFEIDVRGWLDAGVVLAPGTDESKRTLGVRLTSADDVRRALEPVARALRAAGMLDAGGDALALAQSTDHCLYVFAQSRRDDVSSYELGRGLAAGRSLPSGRRALLDLRVLVSHVYYYHGTPRLCMQLVRIALAAPPAPKPSPPENELAAARLHMAEATELYRRASERLYAAERAAGLT